MKLSDPLLLLGLMDPCEDGSMDHDWREGYNSGCELCGEHCAFICAVCGHAVDNVNDMEEYWIIAEEMP